MTEQEIKQKEIFLEETEKQFREMLDDMRKTGKPLRRGIVLVAADLEDSFYGPIAVFARSLVDTNPLTLVIGLILFMDRIFKGLEPGDRDMILKKVKEIFEAGPANSREKTAGARDFLAAMAARVNRTMH